MATNTRSNARRLLTCFCGCTNLTPDDVKRIYRLSAHELLRNQHATKLFRSYLNNQPPGDESTASQALSRYELCEKLIQTVQDNGTISDDDISTLCDMGLPYANERDLKRAIRTNHENEIKRSLLRIQEDCKNEIELSQEYKSFKQALLNKLHNRT